VRVASESSSPEALEGERKTVTALFADIKGSTELMRDLDPEEARAIVDPVLHLMMAAVHRYGGYVAQSTGDGIFALFGAPVAHEDHPQRSLYAALAMQEELHRYADHLRAEGKIPVEARVGVNTGEVVVRTIETGGHTEYTPVGHVTNLAARMQTAAPARSIAVSEATQRLCEGYFEFRALGPTAVKGLDAPVEVYEVVRAGPLRTHFQLAARRGLTRFVGREREMAAMAGALERATAGHGQIVAAVGEAGAGKSRLMYEFKATIPDECKVLEAYSVSHGKASAWLPVLELLRGYFGLQDANNATTRREKVSAALATLDPTLSDALPYLLALLGIQEGTDPLAQMDLRVKRRRTFEAIKRIVVRESLNQPTLVVFEDLHWIDAESQEFLDLLVDSVANARILMLVNYRPEYHDEWGSKSCYRQLRLDPLGGDSADEMLHALLGGDTSLAFLKRLIIEKTQGNPFFIEEIVRALIEQGALICDGAPRLTRPLDVIHVPPTVQAILASRIDALPPPEKGLLQILAVMGKEFPLNLVRRITASSGDRLQSMLKDLGTAEFIYEQPALGEAQYTFKHALTQEVAYNSVLIERRKHLHELIAKAIEELFAGRLDDHLAELAHHYSHSANASKAIEYLNRAGEQAQLRSAFGPAAAYFEEGLGLLSNVPDFGDRAHRELALQTGLAASLLVTKGYASTEVECAHLRARDLCEQTGEYVQLFSVLHGLSTLYTFRLELEKAREIDQQVVAGAEQAQQAMIACSGLAGRLYFGGEFAGAREQADKGAAIFDAGQRLSASLEATRVTCLFYSSLSLLRLGYLDLADKRRREALALARQSSEPYALALALLCGCISSATYHDGRSVEVNARELAAHSSAHGFAIFASWATLYYGAARVYQREAEKGIGELKRGIAEYMATGAAATTYVYMYLAEGYMAVGDLSKGIDAVARGLEVAEETGERIAETELHRLKGELLLLHDPANEEENAERSFQAAAQLAIRQGDKLLELRAKGSLARLLNRQGRGEDARSMLADIYGWFTEGFDTADLKDAKALMDELRS
jgi:predicted ATPase/class 3 adenylate cyclase